MRTQRGATSCNRFFFFQAEDGIRDGHVTGVQTCALPISKLSDEKVEEIAFIIGDFGEEVEQQLLKIAEKLGAKGSIYKQDEPLGTAHAIWMAKESLSGPVVVAFADTLFRADFDLDR